VSLAEEGQVGSAESVAGAASALPAGLTAAACEAFRDVEEEFREGLTAELRRRRRSRRDLTSDDVYEARPIVAHAMCPQSLREVVRPGSAADADPGAGNRQRAGSLRALGTGLIAIGSVGVGSMHPYLHSVSQIALLVIFIAVGLVGVGLTWGSWRHVDASGESFGS
jgi:hypothetical protein